MRQLPMREEPGPDVSAPGVTEGPGRPSLRDLRRAQGLSRTDLSARLHISPGLLYQWERECVQPHPRHRAALALALGVPRDTIDRAVAGAKPAKGDALPAPGIRSRRKQAGVTVPRLAAMVGVHPATVTKWESGRLGVPRSVLPAVARALGSSIESLTSATGAPLHPPPITATPLKAYRLRAGLTRTAVTRATGISSGVLRRLEEGRAVTLGRLRLLAPLYGVPVSHLAACTGTSAPAVLARRSWCPCELPALVVALRDWTDVSAAELAAMCGVGCSTVSRWERGLTYPSRQSLRRLERAFGLPTDALPRGHRSAAGAVPFTETCCTARNTAPDVGTSATGLRAVR